MHGVAEPSAPLLPRPVPIQSIPPAASGYSAASNRPVALRNEFALRGSMGQSPRQIVRVARLIKANMPQRVTRVSEVYKHEAAFCHASPSGGFRALKVPAYSPKPSQLTSWDYF